LANPQHYNTKNSKQSIATTSKNFKLYLQNFNSRQRSLLIQQAYPYCKIS